jgi:Icc protein
MLICQLSDTHVSLPGKRLYGKIDTAAHLAAAVKKIGQLKPQPDIVVITGDLVDGGSVNEYGHLRDLLEPLHMPVFLLPGNHDSREHLVEVFRPHLYLKQSPPFIQYVIESYPVRIVALDTVVPGQPGGALNEGRLTWLERKLAEAPQRPTVLLMHHPPFATHIRWMDGMGLAMPDGLAAIVRRYPNIERVLCGHVHRPIQTRWAGTLASTAPSTAHQVTLDLSGGGETFIMEPPAFQLHRWDQATGIVSHTVYVGEFDGPHPFA